MKGVVEAGSQASEKAEKQEVRVLDEEGILVKTGGQENNTSLFTYGIRHPEFVVSEYLIMFPVNL
jgi:hypothetical protein